MMGAYSSFLSGSPIFYFLTFNEEMWFVDDEQLLKKARIDRREPTERVTLFFILFY